MFFAHLWRGAVFAAAAMLAACDSGSVPTPTEAQRLRPSSLSVDDDKVALRGDGVSAGLKSFYFPAGVNEVKLAFSEVLGEPASDSLNTECGAGALRIIGFDQGLRLHFQDGSLVGWLATLPSETIEVVGDVAVGMPREEAMKADGFLPIPGSSGDGEEFALGTKLGGFIEGGEVSMLYAGKQCFAR